LGRCAVICRREADLLLFVVSRKYNGGRGGRPRRSQIGAAGEGKNGDGYGEAENVLLSFFGVESTLRDPWRPKKAKDVNK